MKRVLVAICAVVVAFAPACKKKAGSSCEGSVSMCGDKATALLCQREKLVEVACRGPMGCTRFGERANCDSSVANVGDLCMPDAEEHQACSPDGKRAVVCEKGHFVRYLECLGEGGCTTIGFQVACDTSIANAGDPCKEPNKTACDAAGKQQLVCQNGIFALQRHCSGTKGCAVKDGLLACDVSISNPGDPCLSSGQVVCAGDGQSELICEGGRFQRGRACRKTPCKVADTPSRAVTCE